MLQKKTHCNIAASTANALDNLNRSMFYVRYNEFCHVIQQLLPGHLFPDLRRCVQVSSIHHRPDLQRHDMPFTPVPSQAVNRSVAAK